MYFYPVNFNRILLQSLWKQLVFVQRVTYVIVVSRGHMIQLICTMPMQAKSLQAINHPNQYDTDYRIHYIDQLVKFDYGTATTNVVTTFVNINGQILRISWKHSS